MAIAQPPVRSQVIRRGMAAPPVGPVTAYARAVVDGSIVAGQLVIRAAKRHLNDLETAAARGRRFDIDEAQRSIDFFPIALRHWKGDLGPRPDHPTGDPVVLAPWQAFIVGAAHGWQRWSDEHSRWVRRFRLIYIEVGKKNGKTLMGAGFGLRLAFFDDEPGAEVYSCATKRDQAKIPWRDARKAVKTSPALSRRIQVAEASFNLSDPATGSLFEPLGRDSDTDQGINVHGAIIDELHVHKDRETYDNIETATSSRTQPMRVVLTTAGVKRSSVWWDVRSDVVSVLEGRAEDDSIFGYIATLDEKDDPFDERVWIKANPNLGVSVQLETLREQAAKAKRSPGAMAGYLRFRMNVPTQQATRWFSIDVWDTGKGGPEIEPGQAGYAGLDLASVQDLTAFVLVFRADDGTYDLLCRFWCPQVGIDERSDRDGVPYRQWVEDGYLIATEGNVTDYDQVFAEIQKLGGEYFIGEIGYDRWNATHLVTMLTNDGASMVPVSQTYTGLSAAAKELEKALLSGGIRHGANPVLCWMAGNVELETDANENIRPSKSKSTERIDGIVALVMAISRWMANGDAPAEWTAA